MRTRSITHPTGVRLRTYLTALVLIPLLFCGVLAWFAFDSRLDDADAAGQVADLVHTAVDISRVDTGVQNELLPSLARTVVQSPLLRHLLGLDEDDVHGLGISSATVTAQRAATDSAVLDLKGQPGQHAFAETTIRLLARARADIDNPLGLTAGYQQVEALSSRLATRTHEITQLTAAAGSGRSVLNPLKDVDLTDTANLASARELTYLYADEYPALGGATPAQGRESWLKSWGQFQAASANVLATATKVASREWQRALSAPAATSLEKQFTGYVLNPAKPLPLADVSMLFAFNTRRATGLIAVETASVQRALRAASTARSAAVRGAALIGVLGLTVFALSLGVAVLVRRSIARPLHVLSRQAESVSRGELVDVISAGPREVHTVALGLSAAVDTLRRIKAQAAAVAAGDLDSDTVREALPGELGLVMHRSVTAIVTAIQERDLAQTDLQYQATHDALTRLPNRTQATVSIEHALQRARRTGSLTGLMFVDLDHFKAVNDNHGHAAGDTVLTVCAERLHGAVRDGDTVYRLGGDEFVVLFEDTSSDFGFVGLADRLIAAISAPIEFPGGVASVGASIGISLCQDASVDAERLLKEADAAAYSAKQAGRGRVGIFDDALRKTLLQRANTERELGRALECDELVLHYQPVVELATGRPNGFEALVRWQHPDGRLRMPDEFIPTAEKSTLINRLGRWTLHEATAQLVEWDTTHPGSIETTMAVNISGRHLVSSVLLEDVRSALADSGLDPSRLIVEITETVLVDDIVALHNMHELRALGVLVAIDDFGTGYTSIGQLPKLPIDLLKIDRSFVASELPSHRQLVRLIVEAAHAFDLTVVAEGIELDSQVTTLNDFKVDVGQGFYFARPVAPEVAIEIARHETLPRTSVPN